MGICHVTRTIARPQKSRHWEKRHPVAETPKTLGDPVREARITKGLTIGMACDELRICRRTLSYWERGLRSIDPKFLKFIEAFLGCAPPLQQKTLTKQNYGDLPPRAETLGTRRSNQDRLA